MLGKKGGREGGVWRVFSKKGERKGGREGGKYENRSENMHLCTNTIYDPFKYLF